MKKTYESPDILIYNLSSNDVITVSGKGGFETGKYQAADDGKNVINF